MCVCVSQVFQSDMLIVLNGPGDLDGISFVMNNIYFTQHKCEKASSGQELLFC